MTQKTSIVVRAVITCTVEVPLDGVWDSSISHEDMRNIAMREGSAKLRNLLDNQATATGCTMVRTIVESRP